MTSTEKAIKAAFFFGHPVVPAPRDSSLGKTVPHLKNKTSEELMDQVANADEKAFTELMRRHYGRCYAVAWRMLRDAGLAQDVVQETFARIWSKSHLWQSRTGGGFAAWAARITSNLAIDEYRRPARQERFFAAMIESAPHPGFDQEAKPDFAPDLADPAQSPEKLYSSQEIGERIKTALAHLPPRQRQAFILCQIDGQSNAEAAAALGVSVGALELLLVRARRHLREDLAELYHLERTTPM